MREASSGSDAIYVEYILSIERMCVSWSLVAIGTNVECSAEIFVLPLRILRCIVSLNARRRADRTRARARVRCREVRYILQNMEKPGGRRLSKWNASSTSKFVRARCALCTRFSLCFSLSLSLSHYASSIYKQVVLFCRRASHRYLKYIEERNSNWSARGTKENKIGKNVLKTYLASFTYKYPLH